MVMKQPMTVSREQLKLFSQLFPMNARPTQALNGRVVREAL
jgi:carbonic anhydrase